MNLKLSRRGFLKLVAAVGAIAAAPALAKPAARPMARRRAAVTAEQSVVMEICDKAGSVLVSVPLTIRPAREGRLPFNGSAMVSEAGFADHFRLFVDEGEDRMQLLAGSIGRPGSGQQFTIDTEGLWPGSDFTIDGFISA